MNQIEDLLTRGVANIIPSKQALEHALKSQKLNVYLGIDPTTTHIHIGHAVNLRKLQQLVKLGYNVTFLVGDFTARVGDNSDKESERPLLSESEIETNWQMYQSQAGKILDFSKVKLRHNSEWLSKLTFGDILKLCQQFSLNDYISREIMRTKLAKGVSIRLDEVLYPIMQGYDSYFMDTDIQICAADQTFNSQAGRTLQRKLRGKESFILVNQYLTGTDGRKMSKSWGNAIWLDDQPNDMYGKIMSIKDELIGEYFTLATTLPIDQIPTSGHPMDLKKKLAWQIVSELHSKEAAASAQANFEAVHQQGSTPTDISEFTVTSRNLIDVLVETKLAPSKSAARRLIEQRGVEVNDQKVTSTHYALGTKHSVVRVGPTKFAKIKTR